MDVKIQPIVAIIEFDKHEVARFLFLLDYVGMGVNRTQDQEEHQIRVEKLLSKFNQDEDTLRAMDDSSTAEFFLDMETVALLYEFRVNQILDKVPITCKAFWEEIQNVSDKIMRKNYLAQNNVRSQ